MHLVANQDTGADLGVQTVALGKPMGERIRLGGLHGSGWAVAPQKPGICTGGGVLNTMCVFGERHRCPVVGQMKEQSGGQYSQ